MYEVIEFLAPQMPDDAPRYLMGVGTPEDLIEAVYARRRYVRLRDADAQRAHGKRVYFARENQYSQREICQRYRAARRGLPVFGLPQIFEGLSAASLSGGRNAGGDFDFAS